jgi:hypothetical protein
MTAPQDDLLKTADALIADMEQLIVEGGSPTNPGFNTRKGLEALRKFACVLRVLSREAETQTRRIIRLTWGLLILTAALLVFTIILAFRG